MKTNQSKGEILVNLDLIRAFSPVYDGAACAVLTDAIASDFVVFHTIDEIEEMINGAYQ
jgi:hypothetical protein